MSSTPTGKNPDSFNRKGAAAIKKNNRGYTLVELMVVVAIIGVCVGLASLSISTVSSAQAKKTASSIDASISKCKIYALSRAQKVYIELSALNGETHVKLFEKDILVSDDVVGGERAPVSYTVNGTDTPISGTNTLKISFSRDTGAFDFSGNTFSPDNCSSIKIAGGGRSYVITLVPSTGAHTLGG
ncbi:MAG: prepilin-type N-terminal cleavage/methylation domain-containing protein [Oscillospiraceae bacterium]